MVYDRPVMSARTLSPLLFASLAACVTTVAPKRPPIAEGSQIRFYPDACKDNGGIEGDVVFSGSGPLGAFTEAPCITGSLTIEASELESLSLPRLSEVGGDVIIRDNGKLSRIDLPLLRIVGGGVFVLNVPKLEQVNLPELAVAGDHVVFGRHRDLDAALSPDSPGSALAAVELPALKAVGGAVVFRNNPKLERFALPSIVRVGDGLLIERNHDLTRFVLAPTAQIFRTIRIDDNDALEDLGGLRDLVTAHGDLVLRDLEELKDLAALANLRKVKGNLQIAHNRLNTLELPALESVGATFEVLDQVNIPKLDFPVLNSVGDRFEIHGNNSLGQVRLTALATVGGNLDISANFDLEQLALPALGRLGGDLGFVDNANLKVLSAPQLAEIQDNLVVKANAQLTGFEFPALTKVHGYVTIQDNPALESLDGLSKVTKIGVKLYVRDNPELPDCAATKLRDQLGPERPMWGEDIGDNAEDSACK